MRGLAALDKARLTRLAVGFQHNLTGLNNSQTLSQNTVPNFSSSQTLLILVIHNTYYNIHNQLITEFFDHFCVFLCT